MIHVYTTTWCGDCRAAKAFLKTHGVAFEEINIEQVEGAATRVQAANAGRCKVPTFEVDGRYFHCSPFDPVKLRRELQLPE